MLSFASGRSDSFFTIWQFFTILYFSTKGRRLTKLYGLFPANFCKKFQSYNYIKASFNVWLKFSNTLKVSRAKWDAIKSKKREESMMSEIFNLELIFLILLLFLVVTDYLFWKYVASKPSCAFSGNKAISFKVLSQHKTNVLMCFTVISMHCLVIL